MHTRSYEFGKISLYVKACHKSVDLQTDTCAYGIRHIVVCPTLNKHTRVPRFFIVWIELYTSMCKWYTPVCKGYTLVYFLENLRVKAKEVSKESRKFGYENKSLEMTKSHLEIMFEILEKCKKWRS